MNTVRIVPSSFDEFLFALGDGDPTAWTSVLVAPGPEGLGSTGVRKAMTAIEKTIKALRAAADALERTGETYNWLLPTFRHPYEFRECDTLAEVEALAHAAIRPDFSGQYDCCAVDASWGVYITVEQAEGQWGPDDLSCVTLQDPRA